MAREKLKDFLTTIGSTQDKLTINIDVADSSPTNIANDGDDLGIDVGTSRELLDLKQDTPEGGLLGDFVEYLSVLSKNAYIISGKNEEGVSSTRGNVLEPAENQGVLDPFIKTSESGTDTLGAIMNSYSSGYFGAEALDKIISKDSSDITLSGIHTHEMLSSIEGAQANKEGDTRSSFVPSEEANIQSQNILAERNRFNPAPDSRFKAFAENPTNATDLDVGTNDAGTSTSQTSYGAYDINAVKMIDENLKDVASSLMLKAAGWDRSSDPGNPDAGITISEDPDAFDFSTDNTAMMGESLVSPDVLASKNAYGAPADESGVSTRSSRGDLLVHDDLDQTKYTKSFGVMNTPESQFSSQQGNDILFAQAVAAIIAMIKVSNDTFNAIGSNADRLIDLGGGPLIAGQSSIIARRAKFQLLRRLTLIQTRYPYSDCVKQGFRIMFNASLGKETGVGPGDARAAIESYQNVQESPGFWLAVSRKILRTFFDLSSMSKSLESYTSPSTSLISNILSSVASSGVVNILNVAATIGDVSLKSTGGTPGLLDASKPISVWNVDELPDGPATRISKSRSQKGQTALSLAWRGNSVPALYMIPKNVIMAAAAMGNLSDGANPLKGIVTSDLVNKTYIDPISGEGPKARIPNDIVERMENQLDAEYVPFYFHDIRTNEIITFHAFLDNLNDTYRPNYSRSPGLGRIDPVQIYRDTSRSISLSFYVAATSKEDFNEMWWKINKLTTLVYPQWTEGTKLSANNDSTFIQPFSQVMASSPIIRLRVGDVIKGNYSKFNLARLFGIGNEGISPQVDETSRGGVIKLTNNANEITNKITDIQLKTTFNAIFGSPLSLITGVYSDKLAKLVKTIGSHALVNGFVNPVGAAIIMRQLQSPDTEISQESLNLTTGGAIQAASSFLRATVGEYLGYRINDFPYLRPTTSNGYIVEANTGDTKSTQTARQYERWRVLRALKCVVVGRTQDIIESERDAHQSSTQKGHARSGNPKFKTRYRVRIIDPTAPIKMLKKVFIVTHEDLMPNPDAMFNTSVAPLISLGETVAGAVQSLANDVATITGTPSDTVDIAMKSAAQFMDESNNPISKAFATTAGRGLAGVINSLSYDFVDGNNTWETDWNSRAPMYFKVSLGFDVIHDITPGIDHSGFNRAPQYNVGDIMRWVSGDPYQDNGEGSHDSYKSNGRHGTKSETPED